MVTETVSFGLSWVIDFGTCRFWLKVIVDVLDENDFNRKTRMMVIMSIIGVMLGSLRTFGSASLRANDRMAFLPSRREMTCGDVFVAIRGFPPQRPCPGTASCCPRWFAWRPGSRRPRRKTCSRP